MIRKRRKLAVHQCQLFNCKDSEQEWQCCNYCSQEGSCEDRCLNDSKKCELLWKGDYKWWLKSAR